MPQEGHGPDLGSRTSGHMGQTKAVDAEVAVLDFWLKVGAAATLVRLTNCEGSEGGLGLGEGVPAPGAPA